MHLIVWKTKNIHYPITIYLRSVFNHRDCEQILRLPLSKTNQSDERVWRGTTNGKFSVKTAYVIAKEVLQLRHGRMNRLGQSSGSVTDEAKWKRVWRCSAPAKVKAFLWRGLHDILAVNKALAKRKVPVDELCPVCGLSDESVSHMLFHCERASRTWLLSPLRLRPELTTSANLG